MPSPPLTFADVLATMLRREPGRPLVTYYDQATGERTELSVTTYANWVAKTASLLQEEYDVGRGDRIAVDLPPHWLGVVFVGAIWSIGGVLTDGTDLAAVVCGPSSLEAHAAGGGLVIACALHPMATRFTVPLPPDVVDFGVEVWSQPDSFVAYDPPAADDLAVDFEVDIEVDLGRGRTTQEELWRLAAAGSVLADGGRLLTTANPASPPGVAVLTESFVKNGSLVLVSGASPERIDAIAAAERTTAAI